MERFFEVKAFVQNFVIVPILDIASNKLKQTFVISLIVNSSVL